MIENEFGEIDIDSQLVARSEVLEGDGRQATSITTLSNGCLCCSVRDDLIAVLNRLWERREEFDHIVIETTGAVVCLFCLFCLFVFFFSVIFICLCLNY